MNILSTLKKLKTSADFAGGIDSLEAERTVALAAVETLKGKREDALFTGGDTVALERDIATAEGKAATLGIALTGAERRRTEATEAEAQAALEATAAAAKKLNTKLRARLIDFGRHAEELAGDAEAIRGLRAKITTANNIVRQGGRGDLVTRDPFNTLAAVVGRIVYDSARGLVIPEYWPRRHPDGPALALLTK